MFVERVQVRIMSPLRVAYEKYLHDCNVAQFANAIEQHGGIEPPPEVDLPIVHRICDVYLEDKWYRIVRVYDLSSREWDMLVYATNAGNDQLGVPYRLQGSGLHQWVIDELAIASDEDSDWEDRTRTNWDYYLNISDKTNLST